MKKTLSLLLAMVLLATMLPLNSFAVTEESDDLPTATVERVYNEILSGEISSEEDVLKVALAQYQNRVKHATYGARSTNTTSESSATIDGDPIPTITQVLEKTTDENGVTTVLVADTGLYVTDSAGRTVLQDQLYIQNTVSLNYSITATHTVYFYYQYSDDITSFENYVKFYKMTTTLFYGATAPSKLEQYYCVDVDYLPVQYLENTVNNPVSGARYHCTSSRAKWELSTDHPYPGFSTMAVVTCNGTEQEIIIDVNSLYGMDYTGTW